MPPQGRGQAARQARHAQGYYPPCCRSVARQPLRAVEGNLGAGGGGGGPELAGPGWVSLRRVWRGSARLGERRLSRLSEAGRGLWSTGAAQGTAAVARRASDGSAAPGARRC
jgi:hypothetical protein